MAKGQVVVQRWHTMAIALLYGNFSWIQRDGLKIRVSRIHLSRYMKRDMSGISEILKQLKLFGVLEKYSNKRTITATLAVPTAFRGMLDEELQGVRD
jgi:hypothetical protein